MHIAIPCRPESFETPKNYSSEPFRPDLGAGLNVMVMAFLLPVAFAIASGAKPERGLFTTIIGSGIIAALSSSRGQIGGPTGALDRANEVLQSPVGGSRALSCDAPITTLTSGNGKPN